MGKFIFPDYEQNLYVTFMTVTLYLLRRHLCRFSRIWLTLDLNKKPVFKHFKLASLSSSLENVNRKILVMIIICIYLAFII